MFNKSLAIALLLLSYSGSSYAIGGSQGDFEVGAYFGYGFLDDYQTNTPKDNYVYGARLGYFIDDHVSFEPSYQVLYTDTDRAAGTNDSMKVGSLRFNLLYNFMSEKMFRPFITGGLGWENTDVHNTFESNDLGVNAGLGLRVFFNGHFAARLEGRYNYTSISKIADDKEHNYEGYLGLSFLFGGKGYSDTDGDGVVDKKDTCPDTPVGATVDEKGCPSDSDSDGVFDGIDQCANSAPGMKVDATGCTVDSDGDGVPDSADQCADTPKGIVVNSQGCPADSDGDGVTDDKDQCPNTLKGTKIDDKGCPVVNKARGVLKGVNFKSGSAELLTASFTTLDEVAAALQEFPNVKVEVQGHTDATGREPTNEKLSQARAETVAAYLGSHGVSADRLVAKGYGSSKPIASNKKRAGRAKNRRVELNWLD